MRRQNAEISDKLPKPKLAKLARRKATPKQPGSSQKTAKKEDALRKHTPVKGVSSHHAGSTMLATATNRHAPRRKLSHSLSKHQVENILAAVDHAGLIECPFNRFTTVNWDVAGVTDHIAARCMLMTLIRDALRG
jgi:hypothetical protein